MTASAGNDLASYRNATLGVIVSLANSANNTGDAAGDVYIFDSDGLNTIEGLEGSDFADFLYGDEGQNILRGGKGADTLSGRRRHRPGRLSRR